MRTKWWFLVAFIALFTIRKHTCTRCRQATHAEKPKVQQRFSVSGKSNTLRCARGARLLSVCIACIKRCFGWDQHRAVVDQHDIAKSTSQMWISLALYDCMWRTSSSSVRSFSMWCVQESAFVVISDSMILWVGLVGPFVLCVLEISNWTLFRQ